jgi:hypothetical protein
LIDFTFEFIRRPTPPILSPSYWTFVKLTLVSSPGAFILEALNESGDSKDCDGKGYDSDEYDATMKKFEEELAQEELEENQAAARQVFMTNKGDDAGQGADDPPSQAAQDAEATREQGDLPPAANATMEGLPRFMADQDHSNPPSPWNSAPKTL